MENEILDNNLKMEWRKELVKTQIAFKPKLFPRLILIYLKYDMAAIPKSKKIDVKFVNK